MEQNEELIVFKRTSKTVWIGLLLMLVMVVIIYPFISKVESKNADVVDVSLIIYAVIGFVLGRIVFGLPNKEEFGPVKQMWRRNACDCLDYMFDVTAIFMLALNSLFITLLSAGVRWQYLWVLTVTAVGSYLQRKATGLSRPNFQELSEQHSLNMGYWIAVSYYHNYLKLLPLCDFKERVRRFSRTNKIDVVEKLFILVPESCHLKASIESPQIERARELIPLHRNVGGIKDRIYNITVYQVLKNQRYDCFWCPVEYAQPLRQLWDLKNEGQMTDIEMHQERAHFVQTLLDLLKDENDSHKTYILLCYNDRENEDYDEAQLLIEACEKYS